MEIDQGKLVEASGSFIKASEYDCENILVIIGKMLTAPIYDHRKNISHIIKVAQKQNMRITAEQLMVGVPIASQRK